MMSQERRTAAELAQAAEVNLAIGRMIRQLRRSTEIGAVGPASVAALTTLLRRGPMRLGDLAHHEGVSAPTMSRMVSAMDKQGYLERIADPQDGRAQLLVPTESARSLVTGITSVRAQRLADALAELPSDEREVLVAALNRLADNLADPAPAAPAG
ncbi:MarR family winged helix-turn-helix transcriptional regulator [Nocardia stercoris]|uniref:MarR family transcriptional regulator n=1 Tax=Nocardia stercoris TaxID=2483361 RepID=A0A3M2L9G5_9NOCA|nr:MarR family transcriptional regulator [Nocardia stercoris]RMI33360.1 MarR family transcriptional regulator [Nocardia stercoris]